MIRTDLALECIEAANLDMASMSDIKGITKNEIHKGNIIIVRVKISDEIVADKLKKPIGEYITFSVSDFKSPSVNIIEEAKIIAEVLSDFFPKNENGALIVGLGNSDITPDALGPKAISYCFATRHISGELKKSTGLNEIKSVCAIAPGVLGKTGIETAEVVKSLVGSLKPSFVVVIDALAAKSVTRLGNTIQVSNTGISPGSGVQNARKELNEHTLGVPVIAVGVPMVVDMSTIAHDMLGENAAKISTNGENMMVTPREIDLCIEHASKMVAYAINKALQPALTMEELVSLI